MTGVQTCALPISPGQQDLRNGVCVETDAEVGYPVVMVPREPEQIGDKAERHALKSIMPADSMQDYQAGHENIAHRREDVPPADDQQRDRKSTRLNSSHIPLYRMPSSA